MKRLKDGQIEEWTDGGTDRLRNKQTEGWTDAGTDGCRDEHTPSAKPMDGRIDG